MADNEKRRSDDHEARSRLQLIDQVNQLQSDSKTDRDHIDQLQADAAENTALSQARLLHELQIHQIELEMQNHELRKVQQRLEEARDSYADLYDFSPIGYLTLDESGRILGINLTGAAMLGDERASIVGKPFLARLAPNDSQLFFLYLNRVFHSVGGSNIVTEAKIKRGNAEIDVRLESAPMTDAAGRGRTCRMVMTDISEQKRATQALQQTHLAQEALLSTIPAMVFFKDKDLRYTVVSQAFADFFGHPAADILGKTCFDLVPHDEAEGFQKTDLSVILSGKPLRNVEHTVPDARGNLLCLSTSLAPYFGPDGKAAGLVGISIDISAIKKAGQRSQELLQQNRQLTQQLFNLQEAERRNLSRELHDELGQWLTAIQAEAATISVGADIAKSPQIQASAQAIGKSAAEIHNVVRRILRRLRPALLDQLGLADSLRELVAQNHQHYPNIACELELDADLGNLPEPLNITLYRIVQEALTNVSKHAQASHVQVSLRREPGVESDPEQMILTVQDNGKGMDSSQLIQGLGMLGMRERVIASGGKFKSHTAPGQGLRIEIQLPLVVPKIERRKT